MSVISMVLVVIVAFLAGMEGVLDEFQFHQPLVACTLIGLVTGQLVPCIILGDRKSTRLNSSHDDISYAVFC